MNMKKILLAGIAIGALASTGANAAVISQVRISGVGLAVNSGTTVTRISLPDGVTFGAARFTALGNGATGAGAFYTGTVFPVGGTPADAATAINTSANVFAGNINPSQANASIPIQFTPNTPGVGNIKSWRVTFALDGTGDPRFVSALTSANFVPVYTGTANAGATTQCAVSAFTVTNGGVVDGNSVTALFSVEDKVGGIAPGGCSVSNSPLGVALVNAPIKMNALGTAGITVTYRNPGDDSIFDNAAASGQLVQYVPVFDIAASDRQINGAVVGGGAFLPTVLAIGTQVPYTSLIPTSATNDAIIGSVKATYLTPTSTANPTVSVGKPTPATGVQSTTSTFFTGLNTDLLPTIAPDILFTNTSGTFASFNPIITGVTVAVVTPARTTATGTAAASATGLAAANVSASITSTLTSISTPQLTTVSIRAVPSSAIAPSAPVVSPLETITLQGTVISAPWFGGPKAATPSLVRLSTSAGVGAVKLTLNNALYNTGDTPITGACDAYTGIAAGGEVIIDTAKVKTCFGDFVRGDLSILVNGAQTGLTAKMRVSNANGTVSELSLSNLPAAQVTSN